MPAGGDSYSSTNILKNSEEKTVLSFFHSLNKLLPDNCMVSVTSFILQILLPVRAKKDNKAEFTLEQVCLVTAELLLRASSIKT